MRDEEDLFDVKLTNCIPHCGDLFNAFYTQVEQVVYKKNLSSHGAAMLYSYGYVHLEDESTKLILLRNVRNRNSIFDILVGCPMKFLVISNK